MFSRFLEKTRKHFHITQHAHRGGAGQSIGGFDTMKYFDISRRQTFYLLWQRQARLRVQL